jgi:Phage capsid family
MNTRPFPLRPDRHALVEASTNALVRAAHACALAIVEPQKSPAGIVKSRYPDDRLAELLTRSASAPAMMSVPGWAQELLRTATADFLVSLGPHSATAEIFQQALSLTFDGTGLIRLPAFVVDFGSSAFVAQGQPIPVYDLTVGTAALEPAKVGAIVVLTRELIESSNAEALIGDALKRACGRMLDEVLVDANPADDARPAGLRNGIAATAASAAADAEDAFVDDITSLADAVSPVSSNSALLFIASPGRALKMRLRMVRDVDNVVVLGSNAVINDLLCIASNSLVCAVGAAPSVEASKTAVLVMDTAPTAIPGSSERSMFQIDAVALKLLWPLSWALRDARGFSWMTPSSW